MENMENESISNVNNSDTEHKYKYLRRTVQMDDMDLNGLADEWLQYLKVNLNRSDNTIQAYSRDIDQFIGFLELKKVGSYLVKTKLIDDWVGWLYRVKRNKPSTLARKLEALRALYAYLARIEIIHHNENPMIDVETPSYETENIIEGISLNELNKMLSAIDTSKPLGCRNYLMLIIYEVAGLRVSELINTRISDFNLENMHITVKGKGGKVRIIKLPVQIEISKNTIIDLKKLCEVYMSKHRLLLCKKELKTDFNFINRSGTKLSRKSINDIFSTIAIKAGIPRHIHPHLARHGCGMLMTDLDIDPKIIQKHLGHKSAKMTDHYRYIRDQKYQNTIGMFGKLSSTLTEKLGLPPEQL